MKIWKEQPEFMEETLGEKIRRMREARGWSQEQLGKRSGLTRGHIATMEHRKAKATGIAALRRLAEAFGVPVGVLSEDAGRLTDGPDEERYETAEDILERLKLAQPVTIPVYTEFPVHAGMVREAPAEYVYRPPSTSARKTTEAYRMHGKSMEPEVQSGDILIVDRSVTPNPGDIVMCLIDGNLRVGKLQDRDGNLWLSNNDESVSLTDCQVSAVVLEINRRVSF